MSRPKATKGNPFYELSFKFDKDGHFHLEPRPILNEERKLGPALKIKAIWPGFDGGLTMRPVVRFLYVENDPIGRLWYKRSDVVRLAEEVEKKCHLCEDPELELNAYLLFPPTFDKRLKLDEEERKRWGLMDNGYVVLPTLFFHVDVEVPEKMREDAQALADTGLL